MMHGRSLSWSDEEDEFVDVANNAMITQPLIHNHQNGVGSSLINHERHVQNEEPTSTMLQQPTPYEHAAERLVAPPTTRTEEIEIAERDSGIVGEEEKQLEAISSESESPTLVTAPSSAPTTPIQTPRTLAVSPLRRMKFSCAACREPFITDEPIDNCELDHRPRLFNTCAHIICTDCCRIIIEKMGENKSAFECPIGQCHTTYRFQAMSDIPIHADAIVRLKQLNELDEYRVGVCGGMNASLGEESFSSNQNPIDECDECEHKAEWYCTRCYACLCELHGQTKLQLKHRSLKLIIPIQEKAAFLRRIASVTSAPICKEHLLPESLYCTLDAEICCQTCSLHSDQHRDHANQVITVVEATEANARRIEEAVKLKTQQSIQQEIQQVHQVHQGQKQLPAPHYHRRTGFERVLIFLSVALINVFALEIASFKSDTIGTIESEFRQLEERLRERKKQLLKEVDDKAEFVRDSVTSTEHYLTQLLHRVSLNREIGECLVSMRSFPSLVKSTDVLQEFEAIQTDYANLMNGHRPTLEGAYCSTFKPLLKEIANLGMVPDIRSCASTDDSVTFTPLGWQSRILMKPKEIDAVKAMLGSNNIPCKLLYRASRDGFTASAFHAKADKRGPTLTLIRARESGNIFGVFNIVPYESCDAGAWMIDPTGLSCILSITNSHHRPFKLMNIENERAMYVKTATGPRIGGKDICMGEVFDALESNTCAPAAYGTLRHYDGDAHTITPEVRYDSHLLAGSPSWTCAEMEVFEVGAFGLLKLLQTSHILRMLDLAHLQRFFRHQTLTSVELVYRASRDGFKADDFHARCLNVGPTIMLVKVAGNNYVFGAYSAVGFPVVPDGQFFEPVSDPTQSSFLFSLHNVYRRPLKLRMKSSDYALYSHRYHGPVFGGSQYSSPDIIFGIKDESIKSSTASTSSAPSSTYVTLPFNHSHGNSINTPINYMIDESVELEAGLPPTTLSSIIHDRRLLAGSPFFKITEMEVYKISS